MKNRGLTKSEKWILWGILIQVPVGAGFHFLYELSGKNILAGIIFPINESVWEHCKMILWPMILFWGICFLVRYKKNSMNGGRWFAALAGALVTSIVFMIAFFYTYSGAFGTENIVMDIIDFVLSIVIGQLAGLRIYQRKRHRCLIGAAGIILVIILMSVVFTFIHPEIPLFIPPNGMS